MFKKNNPGCNTATACGCAQPSQKFTVWGCSIDPVTYGNSPLPLSGQTVTVSSGGTTAATGTTDSNGTFAFSVSAGTYQISVSPSSARFLGTSGTYTVGSGFASGTTLQPSTNYACLPGCALPIARTLNVSSSVYGALAQFTYFPPSGPNKAFWAPSNAQTHAPYAGYAAATNPCPPVTSSGFLSISRSLSTTRIFSMTYTQTVANSLTRPNSCPWAGSGVASQGPSPSITYTAGTQICFPLSLTFVSSFNPDLPVFPSGETITITE